MLKGTDIKNNNNNECIICADFLLQWTISKDEGSYLNRPNKKSQSHNYMYYHSNLTSHLNRFYAFH